MTTNAQAALAAAATVHAGSKGYTSAQTVNNLAWQFKNWLDMQDKRDAERQAEPAETVSHHISCASRRKQACTCNPQPFNGDSSAPAWTRAHARQAGHPCVLCGGVCRSPLPSGTEPGRVIQHHPPCPAPGSAWCKDNCTIL